MFTVTFTPDAVPESVISSSTLPVSAAPTLPTSSVNSEPCLSEPIVSIPSPTPILSTESIVQMPPPATPPCRPPGPILPAPSLAPSTRPLLTPVLTISQPPAALLAPALTFVSPARPPTTSIPVCATVSLPTGIPVVATVSAPTAGVPSVVVGPSVKPSVKSKPSANSTQVA